MWETEGCADTSANLVTTPGGTPLFCITLVPPVTLLFVQIQFRQAAQTMQILVPVGLTLPTTRFTVRPVIALRQKGSLWIRRSRSPAESRCHNWRCSSGQCCRK